MADILPTNTMLPIAYEYQDIIREFRPSLESGQTLTSLTITEWEENDGIEVLENQFSGRFINTFDYGTDRLLYREGDLYSYLDSWEDIESMETKDIYLWKPPTTPRKYSYTVVMRYSSSSGSGGSKRSSGGSTGGSGSISKVYTQLVYPNYDIYAKFLRENLEIRRKAWQELHSKIL